MNRIGAAVFGAWVAVVAWWLFVPHAPQPARDPCRYTHDAREKHHCYEWKNPHKR